MVDYSDIGARIKETRVKKGFTQEQLAEKVGIGPSHMSHIESGRTVPSFEVFLSIVNALECSSDMLLCREIVSAKPILNHWLSELISDCDEVETKILSDALLALKYTLRKNKTTEQ